MFNRFGGWTDTYKKARDPVAVEKERVPGSGRGRVRVCVCLCVILCLSWT